MQNNLGFLILVGMQCFVSFKCLKLRICQLCGPVLLVSGALSVSGGCKGRAVLVFLEEHSLLCSPWACKKGKVLIGLVPLPVHLCNSEEQFGLRQCCPGGGFSICCSCWFWKLLMYVNGVEYIFSSTVGNFF